MFDTVKSGRFIEYIEGSPIIILEQEYIFSLKTDFVLVNNADLNEMAPYAAVHLGLHCLP